MDSFFKELKRRNVFRVAVAYAVIGWLLLQIADILTPALLLPDWIVSAITLILILGFIPTMLFSWAYEITPEGIKKEKDIKRDDSITHITAKKLDYITLFAVIGLAGLIFYQRLNPPVTITPQHAEVQPASSTKADQDKLSIAVLPFIDLSPEKDQEYFSDGLSEEILNVLSNIDELKVASRTSSFGFKGQESLGVPAIAEKLKVRHILEGSVRKSGNMIRITAQLIDSQSDEHIWSQTFDRELTAENLFAIQDEISKAIVNQLDLQLSNESNFEIQADTQNIDAYTAYLEAKQLFLSRKMTPEIITLANKVVEADPEFARGWELLSGIYYVAPTYPAFFNSEIDFWLEAEKAANKAISLSEDLALPYAVIGGIRKIEANYELAIENFNKALAINPDETSSLLWLGELYFTLGYLDKAGALYQRCLDSDPDYKNCRRKLASINLVTGNTEHAFELFEKDLVKGFIYNDQIFFEPAYIATNNHATAKLLIQRFEESTGTPSLAEIRYKALAEKNYNYESYANEINTLYKKDTGKDISFLTYVGNYRALWLKNFAAMHPEQDSLRVLWSPYHVEFNNSPHRKRLIREAGIYDYWKNHGYPKQCKSIGDDDFECD